PILEHLIAQRERPLRPLGRGRHFVDGRIGRVKDRGEVGTENQPWVSHVWCGSMESAGCRWRSDAEAQRASVSSNRVVDEGKDCEQRTSWRTPCIPTQDPLNIVSHI